MGIWRPPAEPINNSRNSESLMNYSRRFVRAHANSAKFYYILSSDGGISFRNCVRQHHPTTFLAIGLRRSATEAAAFVVEMHKSFVKALIFDRVQKKKTHTSWQVFEIIRDPSRYRKSAIHSQRVGMFSHFINCRVIKIFLSGPRSLEQCPNVGIAEWGLMVKLVSGRRGARIARCIRKACKKY